VCARVTVFLQSTLLASCFAITVHTGFRFRCRYLKNLVLLESGTAIASPFRQKAKRFPLTAGVYSLPEYFHTHNIWKRLQMCKSLQPKL
jgi:hypothetical protein